MTVQLAMSFDPVRCSRHRNEGGWCKRDAAPGHSYCQQHLDAMRRRNKVLDEKKKRQRVAEPHYNKGCNTCYGMTHRRPIKTGCRECREPWAPEDVTDAWDQIRTRTVSRWVEPPPLDIENDTGARIASRNIAVSTGGPLKPLPYNGRISKQIEVPIGETIAGCVVIGKAQTLKRETWWVVRCECGQNDAVEGWLLRWRERRGEKHWCEPCRRERGVQKRPKEAGDGK